MTEVVVSKNQLAKKIKKLKAKHKNLKYRTKELSNGKIKLEYKFTSTIKKEAPRKGLFARRRERLKKTSKKTELDEVREELKEERVESRREKSEELNKKISRKYGDIIYKVTVGKTIMFVIADDSKDALKKAKKHNRNKITGLEKHIDESWSISLSDMKKMINKKGKLFLWEVADEDDDIINVVGASVNTLAIGHEKIEMHGFEKQGKIIW